MSIENILKNSIKEKDFDGMITASPQGSRLVWWKKGKVEVHKLWTNFKVSKTVVFSCKDGKISIY